MKKILVVLLAMLLLSACTQTPATPAVTNNSSSAGSATEQTPEPSETLKPSSTPNSSSIPEPKETPQPAETPEPPSAPTPASIADMKLSSAGIANGAMGLAYGEKGTQFVAGNIPSRSLPLKIQYLPEGTKALAISMIDPDGGNWVHWLAVLSVDGTELDIPEDASIAWANRMTQGQNDFGTTGYGGPTPPSGVHTYVITAYALSELPVLTEGFVLNSLKTAMDGKVLAQAKVSGTYAR